MIIYGIAVALLLTACGEAMGQTSFWTNASTPGTPQVTNDTASVTLGMQFYSDVPGSVTAVRFYKGSQNIGTHVGDLWSSTGTKLAEVTFSGETASGWQQANFSSPISIAANTTYVISYAAPQGYYADDEYYSWSALNAAPLHVSGSSPGVYAYGSGAVFPNGTWNGSNYWVDLVFVPSTITTSTYSISGKVSGSAATLTLSGTASSVATTDAYGNYTFSGLANGSYTIAPSQSGYAFTPPSASVSINAASITGVNFTATSTSTITTYSISGKVSGSSAKLTLSGTASAVTTTDAYGNYSFSGLANGSYTVAPRKLGVKFTPSSASVSIIGGSVAGVNFTVTSTTTSYSISGKVSGSAATLTLSGTASAVTTTDSLGNYSFSGVPNGSYTVAPSQSGYAFTPSSASVSISGVSIAGVNFTATSTVPPSTYSISGKVSGSVATLALSGTTSGVTTTDSLGNYSFSGLPNGSYTVAPSQSGYAFTPSSASVSINGASIAGVNFTGTSTTSTYSISGTVSGSAATLTLSGTTSAVTTTGSLGNYSFSGLPNGSYAVAPSQSGYAFTPSSASVSINGVSIAGVNFTATNVHNVSLSWTLSTSPNIIGYNVYRATVSGGPYAKLNSSPMAATAYSDGNVAAGQTYFYVSTAVDSSNMESTNSNQAQALIPTP